MFIVRVLLVTLLLARFAAAQEHVTFPTEDGGVVHADIYGKGDRGVVLAHGGRFNKESWEKQARTLESAGFRVLALDFRGYGKSRGPGDADPMDAPLHLDVLGAVRYLRKTGVKSVSVVGAAWGPEPLAMHRSPRNRVRSIAWCSWADRRTARPKSLSHRRSSSWPATMPAEMDHVFQGFRRSTRKLPNQKR